MNPIPPFHDDKAWRQVLDYLDGSMAAEEVAELNERLRQDPQMRQVFAEVLLQQIKMRELCQEEAGIQEEAVEPFESMETVPAATRQLQPESSAGTPGLGRRRFFPSIIHLQPMLSFVAALVLVMTVLWFWLKPTDVATLVNVDPGVKVVRGGEEIPAANGLVLKENDRIITPTVGQALFQYLNENTRVTVRHSTELGLHVVHRSKNLKLDKGGIDADVAEQQANRPMNLITPQAQALVVGTQFSLITSTGLTRLEVRDGAVRVMKNPEGPSVVVERGQAADILPGQPLAVKPLVPPAGHTTMETWNNLSGVEVSEMRSLLDDSVPPDTEMKMNLLNFHRDGAPQAGHRIRGFLHPPQSGAYTFHVSTSGESEFYLSDSEMPSGAAKLVNLRGDGILSGRSRVVLLQSEQSYYFELLVRHDQARQIVSLNWTKPDGQSGSILGSHVSPFEYPPAEPLE